MCTYIVLHSSVDLQILHPFQAVAQQHSKGIFIYCTFGSVYITVSLSTIVLNSRDWSEIVWLPKFRALTINLAIGFIRKNPLEYIG